MPPPILTCGSGPPLLVISPCHLFSSNPDARSLVRNSHLAPGLMDLALAACRNIFERVEDGSGLVPLSRTLAIVLALEREFDAAELQALVEQLSPSDNGALDFLGLC